jgi:hypothetical protein
MPTKTLLIPVTVLAAETDKISLLEFFIDPVKTQAMPPHNPFQRLAQPGLNEAETAAWRAWATLPPPTAVNVRVISPCLGLTNSAGASLGLALSPFLCAPTAPYRVAIVMGSLEFDRADGGIGVSAVAELPVLFAAIRARGYRMEPTLLIYADDGSDAARHEAAQLAALNIAVRRVETFAEACRACDGKPRLAE